MEITYVNQKEFTLKCRELSSSLARLDDVLYSVAEIRKDSTPVLGSWTGLLLSLALDPYEYKSHE
jgi:hypothetical protein